VEEIRGSTPYSGFLNVGVHLVAVKYSFNVTSGDWKKFIASVERVKTIAIDINIAPKADNFIKFFTNFSIKGTDFFDNTNSLLIK
jgi:hypothetical protein